MTLITGNQANRKGTNHHHKVVTHPSFIISCKDALEMHAKNRSFFLALIINRKKINQHCNFKERDSLFDHGSLRNVSLFLSAHISSSIILTLDAKLEWRMARRLPAGIGGAAGVRSRTGVSNRAEDETHVTEHHAGAYVVHQSNSLRKNMKFQYSK